MCHRLAQRVVRHQRAAAVEARQRTKRHHRVLAVAAGCLGACGPAEQAGARQRDLPAGGAAANHCRDSCPRDVDGGPTSNCAGRGCASIWSGCWRRAQGRCHKPDACSLGRGGCAPGPLPHLQVVAARHICCRRSKLHLDVSVESVAVGNVGACGGRGLACRARRQGTWQHGCAGTTDGEWAQQPLHARSCAAARAGRAGSPSTATADSADSRLDATVFITVWAGQVGQACTGRVDQQSLCSKRQ